MAPREDVTGRILVVEDDGVARAVLARDLREIGHVVAEASTSAEGLEWARTWPPDVVLLDRHLPDRDGMSLLAQLKEEATTRDVPVVMVTGTTEPGFVVQALRAGAHDYLSKPFRHEEVLARTLAALRTKALADELRRLTDHDPETGLRNRRGVAAQLTTWRAHCSRHGLPLAVALLDVVGGRQLDDRALRDLAEALQGSVRAEDVVGRWSGEEFLVLLPQADATTALALVERVNNRLAAQRAGEERLTLRAGVAVVAPGDTEDDEQVLHRAAVALLKQRGPLRRLA